MSRFLAIGALQEASRLRAAATQWLVLLSWPLYLVLALYGPLVLSLFGPGFDAGSGALRVLAVAMLIVMAVGNSQTVLLMSGRSLWQLAVKASAAVLCIALDLWLIPAAGMEGAAVAWAVAVVVDAVAVLALVRWGVGLRTPIRAVVPAAAVSLVAFVPIGVVVPLTAGTGVLPSGIGLALSVALFCLLTFRTRARLDLQPLRHALFRPGNRTRALEVSDEAVPVPAAGADRGAD
jgi:O-antigen/teichoic acid export membrane protein